MRRDLLETYLKGATVVEKIVCSHILKQALHVHI